MQFGAYYCMSDTLGLMFKVSPDGSFIVSPLGRG